LWDEGHLLWLSWTIPACWGIAWMIVRNRPRIEVAIPEIGSRIHWTPQDHAAAAIIEAEENRLDGVTVEQLIDVQFFRDRTLDLATKLCRHYHPKAANPVDELSVVEILTVVQLVAEDLEDWFQKYVPGSHLITVKQWMLLTRAPGWWNTAANVGWAASIAMNPLSIARYAVSRVFVDPLTRQLQTGLLGSFFTLYIRQVGFYLIELNSGRLRGGSVRYRRTMQQMEATSAAVPVSAPAPEPVTVTIAVVGQVKAGKSSLVNCLLGGQRAATDVLPLTKDVDRYQLTLEDSHDHLVLLDTPGYSDAGATHEQMLSTREAVRQADLVLLVMAATSPAKQADAAMLEEVNGWFREQHRLKPPPVVGIVSKIDGLSPLMEWSPPYDWESPSRPKEKAIADAVDYARTAVGNGLAGIVPICSARDQGRVYGLEEWLLPLITVLLDEARAVSLVRSLHASYDRTKLQTTVKQVFEAGKRIKDSVMHLLQS
jgi:predicted GTPase